MSKHHALYPLVRDNIAFDALWQQAKASISALSGNIWSDTGEHDPGITLLQSATYNISDLSYRASLPLNDLLSLPGEGTLFAPEFGPQQTLTCSPISAEDYRRALLDLHSSNIPELAGENTNHGFLLHDARLIKEPAAKGFNWYYDAEKRIYSFPSQENQTTNKLTLRGNYWLYLIPTRYGQKQFQTNEHNINAVIESFLNQWRNLEEQITRIIWLQPIDFFPKISLELKEDVGDINAVVAQIYRCVEQQIMPSAQRYTSEQLHAQGYSNETIYNGPYLLHGWLPKLAPSTISDQGITLNLSPLINQLLAIPGIARIRDLQLYEKTMQHISPVVGERWSLRITSGFYPRLWGEDYLSQLCNNAENSVLKLISKEGIYQKPDKAVLEKLLASEQNLITTGPVTLPAGKVRQFNHYTPIGDRLPECYHSQQPIASTDETQHAQDLRKLHQFLLLIDQMLADDAAELALVPALLSFTERSDQVYGTQWPYKAQSVADSVHKNYRPALTALSLESAAIFPDKNSDTANQENFIQELALLQYLLGYFGTTHAARPLTPNQRDFLTSQRQYLAQQPELGYERSNIRIDKVTAIQKRLAARLGLGSEYFAANPNLSQLPFYLIEHRQLLPLLPDVQFNAEQKPNNVTFLPQDAEYQITLEQKDLAGKLKAGQLIDLIIKDTSHPWEIKCQLVSAVNDTGFTLNTGNSEQLKRLWPRLEKANKDGTLRWRNSEIWLQDMAYPLHYAETQPENPKQRRLAINAPSPFPALARPESEIKIISARLEQDNTHTGEHWSITAKIKDIDQIAGTLLIEKISDNNAEFPSIQESSSYQWHIVNTASEYDPFSFVVSLVCNRQWLKGNSVDPDKLNHWIQQIALSEMPAHVVLLIHWLEENAYHDFAQTYQRWQSQKIPLADDAYKLLSMLTLGQIMSPSLGIGTMHIAETSPPDTPPSKQLEDKWQQQIQEQELFYIPLTH